MTSLLRSLSVAVVCVSLATLGCRIETDEFRTAEELKQSGELGPDPHADHDHDHGDHDHGDHGHGDHGHGDHDHGDHGHAHVAPHSGKLVMLGDHAAQVEFVLDAAAGKLTVYLLDGEAEKPMSLEQSEIHATLTQPAANPDDTPAASELTLSAGEGEGAFVVESDLFQGTGAFRLTLDDIKIGDKEFPGVSFERTAPETTEAPEGE